MEYKERPIIEIQLTEADKRVERACIALLIILWAGVTYGYSTLPDKIPTHYNINNIPDAFDSKVYIFAIPGIATLLYILLSVVNRFPHKFNYLKPVTEENASRMYHSATSMLRVVKMLILIGFITDITNDIIMAHDVTFHTNPISIILQWIPVVLIGAYVFQQVMKFQKSKTKS